MSLLMDALKKAEDAKRRSGESAAPPPEQTPAAPPPARSRLPDLSLLADSVEADLAAVTSEAPARRQAPASRAADERQSEAGERDAVRNVFAAKEPPKPQSALWLIVGLGAVAALGVGAYFWWQLQAVSGGVAVRALPPLTTAQASQPSAPLPLPALPAAASVPSAPAIAPPAAPRPLLRNATESAPTGETAAAFEVRPPRVLKSAAAASAATPESPLRVARSQPKANATLERAYDGLQAGRLAEAERDYELVLRSDAKNTDALLGLATVAMRRGQADAAQAYYLRALESDPTDATAQAGLITMRGQADPGAAESRLKTALAGQPDSAVLFFALGNVYARQQHWSDAQQAYFRAYSSEPDNADIIFNLAVSLDHLHQNKLAAQYYQRALNAAGAGHPAFDPNQVKARLIDLQP